MLLKKHYDAAPPPGFMDGFWPQVDQRIDEGAGGGGGGQDEEIVFKASPALKMLNIPDRKPPEPEQPTGAEAAAPVAPPPPQQQTSYRWPVAFVLAVGVATAGILIHKKMNPPAQAPLERTGRLAAAAPEPEPLAAASQPAAAGDAMVVASAAGSEGMAAGSVGEPGEEPAAGKAAAETTSPRRRPGRHARRRAKGARAKPAKATPDEKPAAGEVKAPPAPKPSPGKKTDLDSLIDGVIGKRPAAAAPAKPAASAAPTSDLPDQLTMNQIRGGMRKVTNLVQACYDKFQIEGKATVRLTIKPAGSISAAAVKGKFFGTDTGACVVKAVKKASFPKFSGKEMKITYPFILQ